MANNNEEKIDREMSMEIKRPRFEDSPSNQVSAPNEMNNFGNLTLQQLAAIGQQLQAQKQALIQQIRDEKLDLAFTRSKLLAALEILSIPFYDSFWNSKQELFTRLDKVILEYEKAFSNSIKEPINSISTALETTFTPLNRFNEYLSKLQFWIYVKENEHKKIDQEMTTVRTQLDQIIGEIESANSDIARINEMLSDDGGDRFVILTPNLEESVQRLSELKTTIDDGSERKNQLEKEIKTLTERCAKNDNDLNSCCEKFNLIKHLPKDLEELRALALQSIEEKQ